MSGFLTVYLHQWLPCRLRMCVPLSCVCLIWMPIIRSGWVLQPLIVMVLQPLTSPTVSGCDQLVVGPSHARGWTLDLLIINVPDLERVAVAAPIGNSDHSSLTGVLYVALAIPNLCVSRKVFLKHQVNWNTVCGAIQDLPRRNIWSGDNPVEVLNEHLLLQVGRFVPTKVIRVRNKDKPWFYDQCRHDFCFKQEAHLRWTRDRSGVNCEEFVSCQVRANETYSEAKHQFSIRNRDVLMNAQSPYKWWSTLKSVLLTWVCHCHRLLVGVVDWCASRLVRLICSQIILKASSPGHLSICLSLSILLWDLPSLLSGRVRSGVYC